MPPRSFRIARGAGPSHLISAALLAVLLLGLGLLSTGCTPAGRAAVADALKVAACVAAHQDEPLASVIARCTLENVTPADIEQLWTSQRAATARAAAAAQHRAGCAAPAPDGAR